MTGREAKSIDQILELWSKQLNDKARLTEGCQHEAKEYLGFTDKYDFCIKCDAKFLDGKWREAPSRQKQSA